MTPTDRILIIDDDADILELLEYNLRKEGYIVQCLNDPRTSIEHASQFHPTLIILDAVMPEMDGFSVCRQLRASPDFNEIPIFILTALMEARFEQHAFGSGADDFIHKMLGMRSLIKRIELVLRKKLVIRKRINNLKIGNWNIIRAEHVVSFEGHSVELSPEEFEVLYFIAQNANRSLNRDHVAQIINGSNLFQLPVSFDKCLEGLIKKLGRRWLTFKGKNGFQFNVG